MEEDVNSKSQDALSQCLYQAMEIAGASTETRDVHRECAIVNELIFNCCIREDIRGNSSSYICGSHYEGTALMDMGSDIDYVGVCEDLEVITNLQDCPKIRLLVIQDNYTPPGYCKLQIVMGGFPVDKIYFDSIPYIQLLISKLLEGFIIDTDVNGRLLCGHPLLENFGLPNPTEIHGPAIQAIGVKGKSHDVDLVWAFRCRCIPRQAMQWFTRHRLYGWPPQEIIDKCQSLGFFVVPVGHPKSNEKDKQWRISLSLQERMLVVMFNSVQLKCFVLMKVLKNEVINKKLGKKVLTSYHCKTCMLYMIETTPRHFWIPTNLLKCITECLVKLHEWTKKKYCPNYFIPEENMFDKLESRDHELLANVLDALLSKDFVHILFRINTSGIGKELLTSYELILNVDFSFLAAGNNSSESQQRIREKIIQKRLMQASANACLGGKLSCHLEFISVLVNIRSGILIEYYSRDLEKVVKSLRSVVGKLESVTKVTEHSVEETKAAYSLLIPFIKPMLMSVEAARLKRTCAPKQEIRDILQGGMWNASSLSVDFLPLKTAATLFVLGYPDDSVKSLGVISKGVRFSICRCDLRRPVPETVMEPLEYLRDRPNMAVDVSTKDLARKVISLCVPFLPTEAAITPNIIIYECLRGLCQLLGKQDGQFPVNANRYEIAFIDGLFLYPFLLYLNHSELNRHDLKSYDVLLMNAVVNKRSVGHKAACLNILGWVLKREGLKLKALECFIRSIQEENGCNAAYWHLLFLISE